MSYSLDQVIAKFNLLEVNLDKTNKKYIAIQEFSNDQNHLEVELLQSVDDFIKKNPSTGRVTSPIFFQGIGKAPNPEGLLSNQIFGLTKEERAGIWGYIDLNDYFIHPLIYKKLIHMDAKFRAIVHGTKKFNISPSGELVEDENGKTGLTWFKKNFSSIKIKTTDSSKRDDRIKFIKDNQNAMFMNKLLVLPPYYRDVNTEQGGKVAIGEINELYASVLISVNALRETMDYGFDTTDSIKGNIQETILAIYDWFAGNNNEALDGATGLSKKLGHIRRAGMSKTTDFGARLVLSAPELKVESVNDLMVTHEYCALPLSAACVNFKPYVIYHVKKFFENEFTPGTQIEVIRKDGTVEWHSVKDASIAFSDERIEEELHKFVHGYANRLIPVEIPLENTNIKVYYKFKGRSTNPGDTAADQVNSPGASKLTSRKMTWCDVFYIAACEAVKDKVILITRYPVDSLYSQFPSKINISTTNETEQVFYNGTLYKFYPKIRPEDIGSDTSNKFVDTLRFFNAYGGRMLADYDGDQTSTKAPYTVESIEELSDFMYSKLMYIGLGGECTVKSGNEAVQAIYNMTKVLPGTVLNEVLF